MTTFQDKKRTRQQKEYKIKAEASAQLLIISAENAKRIEGKTDLVFDEAMLRHFLGPYEDMLYEALNILKSQGRAKEIRPGAWSIDW
jgi:hypothetical protein